MKKKELLKLMSEKPGIKIVVNPEQSKRIQELCFENGITWNVNGNKLLLSELKFLFIENNIIAYETEDEIFYFNRQKAQEIEANKEKLREIPARHGIEEGHMEADDCLCEILEILGYKEIVDIYKKIRKWYA